MSGPSEADSKAIERVMARFGPLVRRAGRRRGLREATLDELCQDVRIRLWHALAGGEQIAAVHASYVYRTALTAALDMIRRRRARREERCVSWSDQIQAADPAADSAPERAVETAELAAQIDRAIGTLGPPRDVVVRLHLAGYRRQEIADKVTQLLVWQYHAPRSRIVEIINQAGQQVQDITGAVNDFCKKNPDVCEFLKTAAAAVIG